MPLVAQEPWGEESFSSTPILLIKSMPKLLKTSLFNKTEENVFLA